MCAEARIHVSGTVPRNVGDKESRSLTQINRRGIMTKEELIAKMAASAGITKVAAGTALQAFTGAATTSLKKGQRVSLVNFGTFTVARRKARLGRNPRTGEALRIPAAKVPKFSAGKILKSAVR